jgi:hypothetical protein
VEDLRLWPPAPARRHCAPTARPRPPAAAAAHSSGRYCPRRQSGARISSGQGCIRGGALGSWGLRGARSAELGKGGLSNSRSADGSVNPGGIAFCSSIEARRSQHVVFAKTLVAHLSADLQRHFLQLPMDLAEACSDLWRVRGQKTGEVRGRRFDCSIRTLAAPVPGWYPQPINEASPRSVLPTYPVLHSCPSG